MFAISVESAPRTTVSTPWQIAALAFALTFPTVMTWLYFVVLAGSPSMQTAYSLGKAVQFGFPLAWVFWIQRQRLRLNGPTLTGVAPGVLFGLAIAAATLALYYGALAVSPILADAPTQVRGKLADFGVDAGWKFLLLAAFYSIVHALLEEYYWRWFVFAQLRALMPVGAAVAVSSTGFMAHHVLVIGVFLEDFGPATWFFSCCVAVGGAFWAWLYHRYHSLYPPWISHLLVDAGLMWVGYELWRAAGG